MIFKPSNYREGGSRLDVNDTLVEIVVHQGTMANCRVLCRLFHVYYPGEKLKAPFIQCANTKSTSENWLSLRSSQKYALLAKMGWLFCELDILPCSLEFFEPVNWPYASASTPWNPLNKSSFVENYPTVIGVSRPKTTRGKPLFIDYYCTWNVR